MKNKENPMGFQATPQNNNNKSPCAAMPASKCHGSHCCYYTSLVTVECPLTPTEARQPRGLSLHPSYTTQLLCDASRGTRGRQQPKRLHGAARLGSTGLIRRHSQPEPPDNLLVQLTPLWSPRSSCTTLPDRLLPEECQLLHRLFSFFPKENEGSWYFCTDRMAACQQLPGLLNKPYS